MKGSMLLYFVFYFSLNVMAQPVFSPLVNTENLNAYSSKYYNAFSFSKNQAVLSKVNNFSLGIAGERRFMLAELNHFSFAAIMPSGAGGFGLMIRHFGFQDYSENAFALAYGRNLTEKISIGLQFDYFSSSVPGYQKTSAIGIEASSIFNLTEKLFAGLHIANPQWGRLNRDDAQGLSQIYSSGLGYEASDKFFIGIEFEKTEDLPIDIHAGINYRFLPLISAKIGMSSVSSSILFGLGMSWRKILFELNCIYNSELGATPGIALHFSPPSRKNAEQ